MTKSNLKYLIAFVVIAAILLAAGITTASWGPSTHMQDCADCEASGTVENDDGERVDRELADTSEDNDPAKRLTRAERIAEVRRAIEALPPDQREIIILKDIQGLSYAQIADLLSIEEGTVGSRISRARKNLEKILRNGKIF